VTLQNWVIQTIARQMRSVKNPSITSRRDTGLIAAICAAPAKGTPRRSPKNCLKITENEVLLRDASIEEPCFAISLRFWHAWRERLARPDQRRLYRKSLQWSQSQLLFPGPNDAPLGRAALHNALRRLNTVGGCSGIGPITPEKIRAAFLGGGPLKGGIRLQRKFLEGFAPLDFAFKAPGSELAGSLKERIQFRYRPHFFLGAEPRFELFERRDVGVGPQPKRKQSRLGRAAKNSTPWTGRSRSTSGSGDRPDRKRRPARVSPPLFFWRPPLLGGTR
jgi:hypothetical protein